MVCLGDYGKSRFFFFKQKTAYEMRISDWSSDVCSSDLTDASPGVDVGALLAGAGRERRRRRERRGDPAPRVGRVDHVVDLEVAGQIGRASCRERVCQYV